MKVMRWCWILWEDCKDAMNRREALTYGFDIIDDTWFQWEN